MRRRRRRGRPLVEVYGDPRFVGVPSLPLELPLDLEQLEYLTRVLAGRTDELGQALFVVFRNALERSQRYVRELEELTRR